MSLIHSTRKDWSQLDAEPVFGGEATWTLLDQSREASDARIAQATIDAVDAAFARGKADQRARKQVLETLEATARTRAQIEKARLR